MSFFVYMILSKHNDRYVSYVGYTNNIKNRILLHNSSKGAKFTKGKIWKLIYLKKYQNKVDAMKNEYKLKKNYKLRTKIKLNYIKDEKKKDIHNLTL
jgi:putative endonuclease